MTQRIVAARLVPIVVACVACAASVLALGTSAAAQTGANVLVVINTASPASETIGRHYVARRAVPPENVCALPLPVSESISRAVYDLQIEQPIWKCIAARRGHDRLLYIVLTKDVPIRVSGTPGRSGTNASVDSELTLLYRRRTDASVPVLGFVPNPYFADTAGPVEPFSHRRHDIYLVTRLDGFTVDDALALIDRAATATADGRFVLDQRASAAEFAADRWLGAAAARLTAQGLGDRVVLNDTATVVTGESHVLGYYSWGSSDDAIQTRTLDLTFQPGALAGLFVSTDGRTFQEPPAAWHPGRRAAAFAGTTDSLLGDLIRAGVTGVAGNVDEPYLDAAIRPDILFPAYASGRNLAEAFYAAMPYLSWQTLIVGDPLCAPFPHAPLPAADADPPIDPATALPTYFAARQLATMHPALGHDAAAAFIRFQDHLLRGDPVGARQALEAAVAAEPRFIPARIELAALADRAGDKDAAIAQYRAILASSPNDPLALNNLAYALAVYQHAPQEALPFAEHATSVARKDPELLGGTHILGNYYSLGAYHREPLVSYSLDTLAWVQHLLGRDVEAATTIRQARSVGVQTAEFMWHAAVIYAAINDAAQAGAELRAAVTADPTLATRDDIQKLRDQLGVVGKPAQK